jgi:tRNA A37 methylthiotransferase MiaB
VESFRDKCPDITIGTDIMVGIPGENERDFEKTLQLITESKPDIDKSSTYSARPGTADSMLEGRLATKVAKDRSARVYELATKTTRERNMQWIGWKGSIVIDEVHQDFVQGRNYTYKPIFIRKGDFVNGSPQLGDQIMVQVQYSTPRALEAVELG